MIYGQGLDRKAMMLLLSCITLFCVLQGTLCVARTDEDGREHLYACGLRYILWGILCCEVICEIVCLGVEDNRACVCIFLSIFGGCMLMACITDVESCVVYDYENGKNITVYDWEKAYGKDPYEMFLSGSKSLLTIENPSAATDRELILFRDSFGSAITPLLLQGYRSVTLVYIRYVTPELLGQFVEFHGQDVLFLYSTTVLNNSSTLK